MKNSDDVSLLDFYINKKAFHSKANRPFADRCMGYIVHKFEQVWGYHVVSGGLGPTEYVWTGPCVVTLGQTDRQTWLKTVPSRNFIGGR